MSRPERPGSAIGDEVLLGEYMLHRAARSRIEIEQQIKDAVALALDSGVSWTRIGQVLGMPVSVVQRRYEVETEQARGA